MSGHSGGIDAKELKQAVAGIGRATRTDTCYCIAPSPIGELLLFGNGEALQGLYLESQSNWPPKKPSWRWDVAPFKAAMAQMAAYFAGELKTFDLPLAPIGTPFHQRVWQELLAIPYGTTTSYGELARRLGDAKASRAVGLANGRNPIAIIIPCHRVIGANGNLTGYGGGLDRKEWLLKHEGALLL